MTAATATCAVAAAACQVALPLEPLAPRLRYRRPGADCAAAATGSGSLLAVGAGRAPPRWPAEGEWWRRSRSQLEQLDPPPPPPLVPSPLPLPPLPPHLPPPFPTHRCQRQPSCGRRRSTTAWAIQRQVAAKDSAPLGHFRRRRRFSRPASAASSASTDHVKTTLIRVMNKKTPE